MQSKVLINVQHEILDASTIERLSKVKKSSKTKWSFGVHLRDGKVISVSNTDEQQTRNLKGEITAKWVDATGAKITTIGE